MTKINNEEQDPMQENYSLHPESIKRRKFLGLSLIGAAGLSMPFSSTASKNRPVENLKHNATFLESELVKKQSDTFDEKIKLIQEAWSKKDYRLVRALSDSIRNTGIQAQVEYEDLGRPLIPVDKYENVSDLPRAWQSWARGWSFYKVLALEEKAGISRSAEPVEVLLSFPSSQVSSLAREIRVASLKDGELTEVISQVFNIVRRGSEVLCKLMFLADSQANEKCTYLVFYSNPDAELPNYITDLQVRGEDYKLEVENQYFTAYLSEQTGQLERIVLKREHGVELYAGGPGHGETPGIDWAHDYVTEDNFQKVRITYWGECPDFEIIRGPICTIVRRWGFPHSAIHPIYTPSRLNIDIEYRFYAGLPYFNKIGKMTATKEFVAVALRDDEWVFTGQPFNQSLWMGSDEKLRMGEIPESEQFSVKGFGYYHSDTKDSFITLYLDHSAEVLSDLLHTGHSLLYYNWHGTTWSRYPLKRNQVVPKGAVLHQKNAYITIAYKPDETPAKIESLRKELLSPLRAIAVELNKNQDAVQASQVLGRRGEVGDSLISKELLWKALHQCIDQQLYIADVNIIELGYIYDLSVSNGIVKVLMSMPHRGRPLASFFIWGSSVVHRTVSKTITGALSEIPGVRKVVVEQTWYPEWNSNMINDEGRKKLGL